MGFLAILQRYVGSLEPDSNLPSFTGTNMVFRPVGQIIHLASPVIWVRHYSAGSIRGRYLGRLVKF
jgi:hypothetical protein